MSALDYPGVNPVYRVQIDEPVLVFDLRPEVKKAFKPAYEAIGSLGAAAPQVTIATYFGDIIHNLDVLPAVANLHALHVDLVRHPEQLDAVIKQLGPKQVLSAGVVDGRNVWKNNFQNSIELVQRAIQALGQERVVVATSSSLLHVPHTLASEKKLPQEVYQWFSFAVEKCHEVAVLAKAVTAGPAAVKPELDANAVAMKSRAESQRTNDPKVKERQSKVTSEMHSRKTGFDNRYSQQKKHLSLPTFPTTTIGSFPQVSWSSLRQGVCLLHRINCPNLTRNRPRRSVSRETNSPRASSPRPSTRSSSVARSTSAFRSRTNSVWMSTSTVNRSVTTWSSTSVRDSRAMFSPRYVLLFPQPGGQEVIG